MSFMYCDSWNIVITLNTVSLTNVDSSVMNQSIAYDYAPNFEKVGDILVLACPYVCVCVCVCVYVFMFEISS